MTAPQKGPVSSITTLQEASKIALDIVNASQKIRRNKAAFTRLADVAAEHIDDMTHFCRIMEGHFTQGIPEELAFAFQRSLDSLKSLSSFTRDIASRDFFMALLFSRSDIKKIKAYDQTLAMNRGSFKIISNTYMTSLVTRLSAETRQALMQRSEAATGVEGTK